MRGAPAEPREITCRKFVGSIRALRDGELSDRDRRSFFLHGRKCARCARYLRGYELTISAIKRIGEDSLDPNETKPPKSLVTRILSNRRASTTVSTRRGTENA
jgi:hypothetical protein